MLRGGRRAGRHWRWRRAELLQGWSTLSHLLASLKLAGFVPSGVQRSQDPPALLQGQAGRFSTPFPLLSILLGTPCSISTTAYAAMLSY